MKARHEFTSEKEWLEYLKTYFAAMAMQGLLVRYFENGMYGNQINYPMVEQVAVMQADALINELNKPTT